MTLFGLWQILLYVVKIKQVLDKTDLFCINEIILNYKNHNKFYSCYFENKLKAVECMDEISDGSVPFRKVPIPTRVLVFCGTERNQKKNVHKQ